MNNLNQIVNPIYTTAKGTAMTLAAGGDKDAIALYPYLDLDEIKKGNQAQTPPEIQRIYVIAQEARFNIYNNAVLSRDESVVVDLPSGYSPRGFRVANARKRYYGFDLPSVIEVMKPACEKTMTDDQKKLVEFASVDATNYDSMKRALGENKEKLCIVTEGLLGYFNESELVSMCQAIHRLLSEYGGCWITADAGILEIYTITYGALTGKDTSAFAAQMKNYASSMADVDFYKNSLFLKGREGALEFLKKQGFSVELESVSRYVKGLRTVDEETEEKLRDQYGRMEIWTLTAASDLSSSAPSAPSTTSDLPGESTKEDRALSFKVQSTVNDGVFSVAIQGRMDTLTAPELLKCFQEAQKSKEAGGGIRAIHVDVSRMAYISSAGLRVLLMMYKSLEDKSGFRMSGVNDGVREILETTGFDQFLL